MGKKQEQKEKEKKTRKGTFWTEEELEQLQEYWGTYSTPTIAKKMGRTVDTIRARAAQLGLGRQIDNSDLVSLNSMLVELGLKNSRGWYAKKLIDAGLPIHTQRVDKKSFRMVDIEEFWEFIEKNKHLLDFSKLEEHTFGCEPKWAKKKRREDYNQGELTKARYERWSEQEDKELIRLTKMQPYTYFDISKRLNRSEGSIRWRISQLGIKEKPLKISTQKSWTTGDVDLLQRMLKEGKSFEQISRALNRSVKVVKGRAYRIYSTESIIKIRAMLNVS